MLPLAPAQGQVLGCHYCFVTPATKVCSACKLVRYCSQDCQRSAWKSHKVACGKLNAQDVFRSPHPLHQLPLALCFAAHDKWNNIPHAIGRILFDEKMATKKGLRSPKEVVALANVPENGPTVLFEEEDGKQRLLSQEEYLQKFGTRFVKGVHVFGQEAIEFLSGSYDNGMINLNATNPIEFCVIQELRTNPPKLKVCMESPLEHPEIGYGLCTETLIKKGTLICTVEGHLTAKIANTRKSNLDSFLCTVNSEDWRLDQGRYTGYARFINDGPPNCAPIRLLDTPQRAEELFAFIATRDIEIGEFIHIYYSDKHPLRRHSEFSLPTSYMKELILFCKEHLGDARGLKKTIEAFEINSLANIYIIGMLQFIFFTPKVLVNLLLTGALDGKIALKLLSTPKTMDIYINGSETSQEELQRVIENTMSLIPDQELIERFLKEAEQLCHGAFLSLIKEIDPKRFPLTVETLPLFLAKGRIFDEVSKYLNAKFMFREPEEEGKEEPLDIKRLLEQYGALPSQLHNDSIPNYIKGISENAQRHKYAAIAEFIGGCLWINSQQGNPEDVIRYLI